MNTPSVTHTENYVARYMKYIMPQCLTCILPTASSVFLAACYIGYSMMAVYYSRDLIIPTIEKQRLK